MTLSIRSTLQWAARAALIAAAAGAFGLFPAARADEGDDEGDALTAKIKAQMDKIVRLMRENEKALLDLSQGGGKGPKPKPVDVKPPEGNSGTTPPAPPPPGMEGEGADKSDTPGERGEEIRRRIQELVEGSKERGQTIPVELEELVRMIPVSQGQSGGSPDSGDPSGKPLPNPDDAAARKAGEKPENGKEPKGSEEKKDPKSPEGQRTGTSDRPPAGGGEDEARKDGVPAWITELPREIRLMLTSGETDKIPEQYRKRIQDYLDSLRKQPKEPGR